MSALLSEAEIMRANLHVR